MARIQSVRCTAMLGHGTHCSSLIARALEEAKSVNDPLRAAQVLHIQAGLLSSSGQVAAALNTLSDVISRYQGLCIRDTRLAAVLIDAACLRDSLGLRADCERLSSLARSCLEAWTSDLGLVQAQAHPELVNLYSSGTDLFCLSLELSARRVS